MALFSTLVTKLLMDNTSFTTGANRAGDSAKKLEATTKSSMRSISDEINKTFGKKSDLGLFLKIAGGGGAIFALQKGLTVIREVTDEVVTQNRAMREGKAGWGDMFNSVARVIPVFGQMYAIARNADELVNRTDEKIEKETNHLDEQKDKWEEVVKSIAKAKATAEQYSETLADQLSDAKHDIAAAETTDELDKQLTDVGYGFETRMRKATEQMNKFLATDAPESLKERIKNETFDLLSALGEAETKTLLQTRDKDTADMMRKRRKDELEGIDEEERKQKESDNKRIQALEKAKSILEDQAVHFDYQVAETRNIRGPIVAVSATNDFQAKMLNNSAKNVELLDKIEKALKALNHDESLNALLTIGGIQ